MSEFKNDFLMGPVFLKTGGERAQNLCLASNAAEDDLSELASLVGTQSKLQPASGEDIAMVDDAPALEFDLEAELARAFQTNEAESERPLEMADMGLNNLFEAAPAAPAPTESISAVPAEPVAATDEPLSMDFSDAIAAEFDRALAEEVAADPQLPDAADAAPAAFPADDIEQELSKLMGFSAQTGEELPEPPAPPVQATVAEPWQAPNVVPEPTAAAVPEIDPAEFATAAELAPEQPQYTPIEMSDFEPLPGETTEPPMPTDPVLDAPVQGHQENSGGGHIDAVLGGAAALAAAAGSKQSQAAPAQTAAAAAAPELDDKDADLRLRLDELDYEHNRDRRRSGRRAAMVIMAIALLGGTAALAWNFVGGDSGETPTLLASTDPVKVKPKNAGGEVVPNQDQAVYKAVEDNAGGAPKQERLTDNKEQPINVAVAPSGPKSASRVTGNDGNADAPLALKPRSVRTVVVRPDGTIVSSGPAPAAPSVLNNDSIGNTVTSLKQQVEREFAAATGAATEQPVNADAPTKVATVKVRSATSESAAANPAPTTSTETTATVPTAKPEPKVEAPAVANTETPKPAAPLAADELPQVASPYAVQVSSQRSVAAAKQSYATLSRRYASILNGKGVDMRQVEVKGKTYYRVRIPAQTRSEANQICGELKASGGDCFVTR